MMSNNNLDGLIPDEIGLLTKLEYMYVIHLSLPL